MMKNTYSDKSNSNTPEQPNRYFGRINSLGLLALYKKEVFRFLKVYMQTIIGPVVTTLLFLGIFILSVGAFRPQINGMPFILFLCSGLIMMNILQNAFLNVSSSLIGSKMMGNIYEIITAPLTSFEFFIGYIFASVTRGLLVGFVTAMSFIVFVSLPIHSFVILFVYAFLGAYLMALLGLLAGLYCTKFDHMQAITNFLVTPLTFLSGTFYGLSQLPDSLYFIALYNPFFYAIDGFRYGITGKVEGDIVFGLFFLVSLNIIFSCVCYFLLKKGYGLKE